MNQDTANRIVRSLPTELKKLDVKQMASLLLWAERALTNQEGIAYARKK